VIVFDATMLLLFMRPDVNPPIDENTGKPVKNVKERITAFINQLEKDKTRIIVPTPALSELLVRAGESMQLLVNTIQKSSVFSLEPFDTRAAIEVAVMAHKEIDAGNKKGGVDSTWAKIKYDRQIIAIAKVNNASTIYSDDRDIHGMAEKAKINVLRLVDLPVPKEMLQEELDLDPQSKEDPNKS